MSRKRLPPQQEQDVGASSGERATDETTDAANTENRVSHVRDGKQERPKDRQLQVQAPPTRGGTTAELNHGWSHGRSESDPAP